MNVVSKAFSAQLTLTFVGSITGSMVIIIIQFEFWVEQGMFWFGSLLFASFCHVWCRNRNSLSFARLSGTQSLELTGTLILPYMTWKNNPKTRQQSTKPQTSHQTVPAEVALCSWEGRALFKCISWRFGSEGPWVHAVHVAGWEYGQHGGVETCCRLAVG